MLISSRRTGTDEDISSFGASGNGRDYTSVNTFESDTDVNLITSTTSYVLECYPDSPSYDVAVAFVGATTSSQYFRMIRPAPAHKHDGTASTGVKFACTGVISGASFRIDEANFQMQDLVLRGTYNSTGTCIVVQFVQSGTLVGVIIDGATNSSSGKGMGFSHSSSTATANVINCLGYDCKNEVFNLGSSGTSFVYNCTALNSEYGIRVPSDGICTVKNCLCDGNSVEDFEGGSTVTASSRNLSVGDASTPMPSNSFTNQTFTFVNAGSFDFHLAATDTGARGRGVDLSSDSSYAFNDDIDGNEIGTWSIGAHSIPAIDAPAPYFYRMHI